MELADVLGSQAVAAAGRARQTGHLGEPGPGANPDQARLAPRGLGD